MVQTLIPPPARGRVRPLGRTGRVLGFGFTGRTLLLLAVGLALLLPAFWHRRALWLPVAWDALVLAVALAEVWRLPRPGELEVTRSFLDAPQLGEATRVELTVECRMARVLDVRITDDLHPALTGHPETLRIELVGLEPASTTLVLFPLRRGTVSLGLVFVRWRGVLGLVERWGAAAPEVVLEASGRQALAEREDPGTRQQRVRVYPAHSVPRADNALFLLRAHQLERQQRQQRLRGSGREFEALRDYQPGDEVRAISWKASARRGRLITRQFMAERSQNVWAVLDAGRLSRTALELRRGEAPLYMGETATEHEAAHRLVVTQLDQATSAAVMLGQVAGQSGDTFGLLSYGRTVTQQLSPGAGAGHLRLLVDLLSATESDPAESDPLLAAVRLEQLQRRRGLFLWFAELPDTVDLPPLVTAVARLARRHVVVLVLLHQSELETLANTVPVDRRTMFAAAAATEMRERRRDRVRTLERAGVLVLETSAAETGMRAVSEYLEVKARGSL